MPNLLQNLAALPPEFTVSKTFLQYNKRKAQILTLCYILWYFGTH